MTRYRSKPAEVDADQWFPDKVVRGVYHDSRGCYVITIHNQKCYVESGDWIVVEPDGIHCYPVKDDIFHKRWEPIPKG